MNRKIIAHPAFWGIATLKLLSGFVFTSRYLSELFVPFVRFFVDSGGQNPWQEFFQRGVLDAFPYSSVMLFLLSLPTAIVSLFFGGAAHIPDSLQLFLMRLPMFIGDVAIYLVLCSWFERQWRSVLLLYWCSPVLFFISYMHGQIDVIPTAFLFLSFWCAIRLKPLSAGFLLAAGCATKFHLLASIPLISFFFFKRSSREDRWPLLLRFIPSLAAGLLVFISPWLASEGYQALVLNAKESHLIYDFMIQLPNQQQFFLCPAIILLLILHFFSYERITKDVLILYTGLLYSVLILLVPPMPGWAYWSVPFLCYFLIRQNFAHYSPYWVYSASYIVYYLFLAPNIAQWPADQLQTAWPQASNILFTTMQASLALVVIWMYRGGVKAYATYKRQNVVRSIGIGGDSASGKHTLALSLTNLLGSEQTVRMHGDDYHRWPRHHDMWKTQTHLDPRSNYFRQPLEHILELKAGTSILKSTYDHEKGTFTEPETVDPNRFIIFEGLHPFVFGRMREVFDIKIFLATEENLRRHWKQHRDNKERGHAPSKIKQEIERRMPDSKRYIQPQAQFADWVIEYSQNKEKQLVARHQVTSAVVGIENLIDELNRLPKQTLQISWSMDADLKRQVFDIEGSLPAKKVREIALKLFPNLDSILSEQTTHWESDLQGINQLVFLTILNEADAVRNP